ncbi:uncharacterized protein LOC135501749 [Lineus longissimus]|uniref:uncharacterized protein LOC135501749 n=1 Tax=Lineus longissimus TaxID=88925 RepID=UPI002B4F6E2F
MAASKTFLITLLCGLFSCLSAWDRSTFRSLFEKEPNMYLLSSNSPPHEDVDLEQCAKLCVKETMFDCKSFDYIVTIRRCVLHALGEGDPAETLQFDNKFDHISRGGSLLMKLPNTRLYSVGLGYQNHTYHNVTLEQCTELCVSIRKFKCLSFDLSKVGGMCILHSGTVRHPTERLVKSKGTDHYKTAYHRLFRQLPFHSINVPYNHKHEYIASLEECARRCILEIKFKCRSLVYKELTGNCLLSEHSSHTDVGGANLRTHTEDANYFERIPDGALESFVNFGLGNIMTQSSGNMLLAQSPGECAKRCLAVPTTQCASFDYQTLTKSCFLSKYTAGSVRGLALTQRDQTIHYERIDENLSYFYTTPYAIVPGANLRTFHGISPERCARYCIEEEIFVCRSFDYRIMDAACLLSTKTGSDVGGLYKQPSVQLHYFEMKPILDCGGVFTDTAGDFASMNWPRDYDSNINCTWMIKAPRNKVIHLRFTHFDLVSESSCSQNGDRLEVTEITEGGVRRGSTTKCLPSTTKNWVSQYNVINVTFVTDNHLSAQGFRVFYSMEWPCTGAIFTEKNGEFASPKWPENYPSKTKCNYLIVAPAGHTIRLNFTHFDLDSHLLSGNCIAQADHVSVMNGRNEYAPMIGRYCDSQLPPSMLESKANFMYIEFWSDGEVVKSGFHAKYEVIEKGTSIGNTASKYETTTRKGKGKTIKKGDLKAEDYTALLGTGSPNVTVTYVLANSTGDDSDGNGILTYIVKKQTALVAAIVLAVIVLAGLLTAGVIVCRRSRASMTMRQNERGYLLHDNLSVSARVSSMDLTDGHTTEPHYESVDEHTLFINTLNTTGALQNPTYDRTSPELPPRPQPDVVS